jgi:integrase
MIKFKKIAVEISSFGMTSYDLLHPDTAQSLPFYAEYLHKIIRDQVANRKQSQNTIDAIATDLKVFLEYVYNAQEAFFEKDIGTSSSLLSEIILSYPDYLAYATHSQQPIARATAIATGRKPVAKSTVNRYLSSVNGFVSASATHHERVVQAKEHNLIDIDVPSENIHASLLRRRELTSYERKSLRERSVMAQVISGGGKYINSTLFGISSVYGGTAEDKYKYFPITHIEHLLDAAKSYRDRALWALLAGGGLRMSEASQLLVSDVDIVNETLGVFTYLDRIENFDGVKAKDAKKLSFKGRETTEAFFIYPFGEIFFESIALYLQYERPKGCTHNYLFVTNGNRGRGRPLFATSRSNRLSAIKKAQTLINCPLKNDRGYQYTLHSLRHFYGHWLLNFHITAGGQKLTLLEVQYMMGHASIESTKKYAVINDILAKEKMRLANLVLQNKSINGGSNLLHNHQKSLVDSLLSGIRNAN